MPAPGRHTLLRGRVYAAQLAHVDGEKYYLVVSNNRRNARLPQVLAVRLTTSPKPSTPSIVELDQSEVFCGRAVCDDIETLWPDEVRRDLGAVTSGAMARIVVGLRAALDI
ncbi:MAG TPA: type II toxin-antitoxin system PemK/MazF family toxin [Streptosporangiaceae bacterium]